MGPWRDARQLRAEHARRTRPARVMVPLRAIRGEPRRRQGMIGNLLNLDVRRRAVGDPRPDARDLARRRERVRASVRSLHRRAHRGRPVRRAARDRQPHVGWRPGCCRGGGRSVRHRRQSGPHAGSSSRHGAVHRHRRFDEARGRGGRPRLARAPRPPRCACAFMCRARRRSPGQDDRRRCPRHVRRARSRPRGLARDLDRARRRSASTFGPACMPARSRSPPTTSLGWPSTSRPASPRSPAPTSPRQQHGPRPRLRVGRGVQRPWQPRPEGRARSVASLRGRIQPPMTDPI